MNIYLSLEATAAGKRSLLAVNTRALATKNMAICTMEHKSLLTEQIIKLCPLQFCLTLQNKVCINDGPAIWPTIYVD